MIIILKTFQVLFHKSTRSQCFFFKVHVKCFLKKNFYNLKITSNFFVCKTWVLLQCLEHLVLGSMRCICRGGWGIDGIQGLPSMTRAQAWHAWSMREFPGIIPNKIKISKCLIKKVMYFKILTLAISLVTIHP